MKGRMRRGFALLKRGVLAVALAILATVAPAQDEPAEGATVRRRRPSEMPKVATSADNVVSVVAADVPGDPMGFRLPILQFATRTIHSLERTYKLEMPKRRSAAIVIHALDGMTNDTRVIARWTARTRQTRIWLPAPGFSDLEDLRFEVAKAWFRTWLERNRAGGGTECLLPDWVVQGAVRVASATESRTDTLDAHDDTRFVLELWSSARLPFFPALCQHLRVTKGPAAALSGYLVGWMREKKMFKRMLERLANGTPWDGAWLAAELTGETIPIRQDRVSDERLARLTRAVLSPGHASEWDLKVFTSRLLLYPPEFDKNIGANHTSCTFREAAEWASADETVRAAAWRKAREMPFCAIGRGDGLAEAASVYRVFLLGVVRGDEPAALRPLLDEAEDVMEKILNENRKNDNR